MLPKEKPKVPQAIQLTLNLNITQSYLPEDFIVSECNQEAFNYISNWPKWHSHCCIIYGPTGSGKTHLANVWHYYNNAITVSLNDLKDVNLDKFCTHNKAIILDDDDINGHEELLFHLYNTAKELGSNILILLKTNVASQKIKLADLSSRLMSSPQFKMDLPDDQMVHMLIMKHLVDCQLPTDDKLIGYIAQRVPRSYQEIIEFVHKLSQDLESKKAKLTIASIKAFIG